jgi:hypothetical protein
MGTPVKIRAREEQCVGAGPCSNPRPMTEEEMLKYYTKEEIEKMSAKIIPPEREKLIEVLAEVEGKTKAMLHASDTFSASPATVYGWIKGYGIEFDDNGKVIGEAEEFKELDKQMQEVAKVVGDSTVPAPEIKVVLDEGGIHHELVEKTKADIVNDSTITIKGQETKEIPVKIGYVEYEVGKSTVIVDYRAELVAINGMEFSKDEADSIADLLVNIL